MDEVSRAPAELLALAWAAEPELRLDERSAALDGLERCLDVPAPDGRHWEDELRAERAIDLARLDRTDEAEQLAHQVLDRPGPTRSPIAEARATEALGRALAWSGTDADSAEAERVLLLAAARYEALGRPEWQGFVLFWLGNAVHLQNGHLRQAAGLMGDAQGLLASDPARRGMVASFEADVLTALGDWDGAARALAVAEEDARAPATRAYATWSRARLASARDDVVATERLLGEVERHLAEWFDIHTGAMFLADAAELLDRVGLREQAEAYLRRAVDRSPEDAFVRQAVAALQARLGPPLEALDALQELVRGQWFEKRLRWRVTMLRAWATLRAGGAQAGAIAALGLEQAVQSGGGGAEGGAVAVRGEPGLVRALLPLAEAAGSPIARQLLLARAGSSAPAELVIRLFGRSSCRWADGTAVDLPPGRPSELVRMLCVCPEGLPTDVVLDRFFPDAPLPAARQRLRQVLTRLRAAAGGSVVIREGDHLYLAPAWVDLEAFRTLTDEVRAARGSRAVELAHGAVALWTGPPLAQDRYADWAIDERERYLSRYLAMLDIIAEDASRRGSHDEAAAALIAAVEADPDGSAPRRDALARSWRLSQDGDRMPR